ncbi:hypothetical protein ODV20_08955 [Lactobacillus amylovorus]|nr:hypothetical protein [Lactobacillus amylovorus]
MANAGVASSTDIFSELQYKEVYDPIHSTNDEEDYNYVVSGVKG